MIVIASDHGGYAMKEELKAYLTEKGTAFEDVGTYSEASCDYPEYAWGCPRGRICTCPSPGRRAPAS